MKRSPVLRICSGSALAIKPCAQAQRFHAWASLLCLCAENTSTLSITGRLAMQPVSVPCASNHVCKACQPVHKG